MYPTTMTGQRRRRSLTALIENSDSRLIRVQTARIRSAIGTSRHQKMDFCKIGGGETVFCNPPYSKISAWVEKAYMESLKDNTIVVMLIPARTDTRYFHDFIYHRSEVRFIRGRLKFGDAKNNAPFPSMVVIFRSAKYKEN